MIELFTREVPFPTMSALQVAAKIASKELIPTVPTGVMNLNIKF